MERAIESDGVIVLVSATHGHDLPLIDAEPGTYRYEDGCSVEVSEDGIHTYTPAGWQ